MIIQRQLVGVVFSLINIFLGLIIGLLIKKITSEVSLTTTLFYRFLLSLPILFVFAIYTRGKSIFLITRKRALAVRIVFGFAGMVFWVTSVRNLPLGQATALFQSSVIFVTILSPFFLNENIGFYRWGSVVFGLVGVLIITDPFSGNLTYHILYGILAAISAAVLSISLRRLGKNDYPASVAFIYNLAGTLVMACVIIIYPMEAQVSLKETWIYLCLLGIFTSLSQIFLTSAYYHADAVVVMSMRYVQVPLAGIAAYFIFSEKMTFFEIFGAIIIISSCLIIAWRERRR